VLNLILRGRARQKNGLILREQTPKTAGLARPISAFFENDVNTCVKRWKKMKSLKSST